MSAFYREKVLSVRHWTDTGFRFQNGQFAMIGLEVDGRPLLRAYSMASANHEEELEFFSIKVADGPLTSKLQRIQEGDTILVGRKATGTLIADNLIAGRTLTSTSATRPSCWSMAADRFPSLLMANSWWRSCATMSCSGRC